MSEAASGARKRKHGVDEEGGGAGVNQSVTTSARILAELASSAQPLGVSELARRLCESKPRIFRHLATMRQVGFVSQEHSGDDYRLGWNIYRLGVAAAEQVGVMHLAERHMTRLRNETNDTVALAIPANGEALVVGSVQSDRPISLAVRHGVVIPANSSALARVLLAFSSEEVQKRVLARVPKALSESAITDPALLRKRLVFVNQHWYEVASNENAYGVSTLAAPVFDHDDCIIAAVGIVAPGNTIGKTPDAGLLAAVQGCAAAISADLNSTAWTQRKRPT
jgi:IclR family transcriptional regulator, KDG regulon repressor